MKPAEQVQFRKKLIAWYRAHARDLPWRANRDPYCIWVSETMLQQTQVATVIPYYLRFLQRFPDLPSLAAASIEEVLPLWSGLGYYRRVKNLHSAARIVLEKHAGKVPCDRQELLALPGVGRYTAGAILSLAYDLPEPVVDGNVIRVLTRMTALRGNPQREAQSKKLWRLAESLMAGTSPSEFNQGLMELGATVCLPRQPLCLLCPLKSLCRGRIKGIASALPDKGTSRRSEQHLLVVGLIGRGSGLLILKRDHPTLMTGLWELPVLEVGELAKVDAEGISSRFQSELGLRLVGMQWIGQARHAITYRRIRMQVFSARLCGGIPPALKSRYFARWMRPNERERFGMSSLSLKALRLLEEWAGSKRIAKEAASSR